MRHEGYLGAIGAFLHDPPAEANITTLTENFSDIEISSKNLPYAVGSLEGIPADLGIFSLLSDYQTYEPDTLNISEPKIKAYWIDLLDLNLKDLVEIAVEKQEDVTKAAKFEEIFRERLNTLRSNSSAYGKLSVRHLLNIREQCLRKMGFSDIFHQIKIQETSKALEQLPGFLAALDQLPREDLVDTLLDNILAGNMYDWGSSEIQQMFSTGNFDFKSAKDTIKFNSILNNKKDFIKKLEKTKYKKIVIFVDNSGFDICLGIIPFCRFMVSKGTSVVLAANAQPSVNDVTVKKIVN